MQAPAALAKFRTPSTPHSIVQVVAFSSTIIHRHAPTCLRVPFRKTLRKRNFTYVGTPTTAHQTHTRTHTYTHAYINPLNAVLNPICHLLALLGAHRILHVSGIRVNNFTGNPITLH